MAQTARWASPWLAALAISASTAYGLTAAVAGADSVDGRSEMVTTAMDGPVSIDACETPSNYVLLKAVGLGRSDVCDTTCGRMLYVGLNSWIPDRFAGYCHGD